MGAKKGRPQGEKSKKNRGSDIQRDLGIQLLGTKKRSVKEEKREFIR